MVNSARNPRQSRRANGVPARNPTPRPVNSSAISGALRHAAARLLISLPVTTIAGSTASALLYFVDAARPERSPAATTRRGVTPLAAQTAAAQNAQMVRNAAGTSVD